MKADCLFCKIIARALPAQVVHEDDDCVVIKDINPKAPTHVLVIPRKHLACLTDSTDDDAVLLGRLQRAAAAFAAKAGLGKGFRLVTNNGREAGQTVDHLHYHLLGGRPMEWPPG